MPKRNTREINDKRNGARNIFFNIVARDSNEDRETEDEYITRAWERKGSEREKVDAAKV